MHLLFLPCSLLALWTAWCSQLGPDLVTCLGYCHVSKCDRSRSLTSTCRGLVLSYSSWSFCYHEKQPRQATRLMRNIWTGNSIDLADNLQTIHKWGQAGVSSNQTIKLSCKRKPSKWIQLAQFWIIAKRAYKIMI